jgi:hypothetical protein
MLTASAIENALSVSVLPNEDILTKEIEVMERLCR